MNDEIDSQAGREAVAEVNHFLKLIGCIDVQQGEWDGSGVERLLGEADHYGRILTDRVEHDGPLEFGCDLANDVDALGFEGLQVADSPSHDSF